MNIRIANIEDLNRIIQITNKCVTHLNNQHIFQWDELYPTKNDFLEDIENEFLFVVSQHETVQGCVCVNEREHPGYEKANWKGEKFCVIHKLITNPKLEETGYGKALMAHVETFAKSNQMDSIRLDCFTLNKRANRFYNSLGYVKRGETSFRKGLFNLYEKRI